MSYMNGSYPKGFIDSTEMKHLYNNFVQLLFYIKDSYLLINRNQLCDDILYPLLPFFYSYNNL